MGAAGPFCVRRIKMRSRTCDSRLKTAELLRFGPYFAGFPRCPCGWCGKPWDRLDTGRCRILRRMGTRCSRRSGLKTPDVCACADPVLAYVVFHRPCGQDFVLPALRKQLITMISHGIHCSHDEGRQGAHQRPRTEHQKQKTSRFHTGTVFHRDNKDPARGRADIPPGGARSRRHPLSGSGGGLNNGSCSTRRISFHGGARGP